MVKWIGALGMPDSEAEDLAQEVFLVVNRKLSTFDGGNEAGWLYRITELTVRDHRRRAWFRNLFRRRRQDVDIETVARVEGIPALAHEHEQDRVVLQRILAKMSTKLRATFVLFEIEGRSGEEIAAIQGIPTRDGLDAPSQCAEGVLEIGGRASPPRGGDEMKRLRDECRRRSDARARDETPSLWESESAAPLARDETTRLGETGRGEDHRSVCQDDEALLRQAT